MEDGLIMSKKALFRKTIMDDVERGLLSLSDAAKRLGVVYRQVQRIRRRYAKEREAGLLHKGKGRRAHNAYAEEFKDKILGLYREKYLEFGPVFAAEKLEEDDSIQISDETLRLWLKEAGLWTRKRKHRIYRERRERRARFGDLLQIDGSIHAWFPDDAEHYCLLNMVDDATGKCLALMDTGETTFILLTALKKWIELYGVPRAVYVDLKSVYVSPKHWKNRYDDDGQPEGFGVFGQVCKKLGIEIIRAYSPQAKGRVERKHALFQDRLVKDIKLYKLKNLEVVNQYLLEKFLPKVNEKYEVKATSKEDGHRCARVYGNLDQIICWEYSRQLRNDWTIRLNHRHYQVRKPADLYAADAPTPGQFIVIRKDLSDQLEFWFKDKRLSFGVLSRKPLPAAKAVKQPKGPVPSSALSARARKNKSKTPWSQWRLK